MSLFRRALALPMLAGAVFAAMPLSEAVHAAAPGREAVYVASNQTAGNSVLRFGQRRDAGHVEAGAYPTGGTGPAAPDRRHRTGGGRGSQGAVTVDDRGRYLYVVNPGSASLSSFRVRRHGLEPIDVVPSGGTMPTSVTVHGDLV
jgi:hypothetical protein